MPPGQRKRILIAFHWYLESLHEGVLRYCVEKGWDALVLNADSLPTLEKRSCDGIIGMLAGPDHPVHRFVAASAVPVVELSPSYPQHTHWSRLGSDGGEVGRIAAEYLRRRPVASFLFVCTGASPTHDLRREGFRKGLAGDNRPVFHLDSESVEADGAARVAELLKTLPRPVGVFGSVDQSARQALRAALDLGYSVPGDIYLMGFGNRELFSRIAPVPITTIGVDYEAWGYAAAGLLDDVMSGRAEPGTRRSFSPGALIERASTGGDSGGDPLCAKALALMKDHVDAPLDVAGISTRLGVSKATLDRAFSAAFGMGVAARYLLLRLEVAKGLLASGEKTEAVAASVGFASARAFRSAFQKAAGCSPGEYGKTGAGDPGTH